MLTKDRKPPDGFSDWDSFYEHGASRSQAEVHERVAEHILEGDVFEILPKLERAPSPYDHVLSRADD